MKGLRCLALLGFLCSVTPAFAGSHLWRIQEVFSNADGTIQFVELHEPVGAANETGISGRWVLSTSTSAQFTFPANLPAGSTANKSLLLATAGFAALPGAPAPDYIIPDNFVDLNADTLEYWLYVTGDMTYTGLPTDGVLSMDRDGSVGTNSPTNFAGDTGTVDASGGPIGTDLFVRGDVNGSGSVDTLTDVIFLLNFGFQGGAAPGCDRAADINDDGSVSVLTDALYMLAAAFTGGPPIPEPSVCGVDPTTDVLSCNTSPCSVLKK